MSDWQIHCGDCIEVLRNMPAKSVHMCVTSPPYFGLRNYGIDGQIGLETTPTEFVAKMVEVFNEVARVLRDDGTLWLNLGDSYAGSGQGWQKEGGSSIKREWLSEFGRPNNYISSRQSNGLKPKDLMLIPARVAIALQEAGWYVRSDIIWCKRAPMPESVTDRPTSAHEHIFLLSKQERYYFDSDAIREPQAEPERGAYGTRVALKDERPESGIRNRTLNEMDRNGNGRAYNPLGRNSWNYWILSPEPYAAAHFATYPTEIPRRAILAGTSEHGCCGECGAPYRRVVERVANYGARQDRAQPNGVMPQVDSSEWKPATVTDKGWQPTCRHTDAPIVPATVLDCFSGAGTTVMQALRLGRCGIGIELSPAYCDLARQRIVADAPLFNTVLEGVA